ncbi:MAG: hypothetical protein IIA83_05240 [Thaumarchaeota archaeon]|nr:hypothetical protein [Nitrososphaerota archaeon]
MGAEGVNFESGFLYPLYLLLIGAVISGGLIPYFHKLNEIKLRKIEKEREESQKRIDREREDYRFELEIKERLNEKLSDETSWCFKKFKQLAKDSIPSQSHSDAIDEELMRDGQITNLIDLYFKNPELTKQRERVCKMIISGFTLASLPANSKERKEQLEKFQKEFGITLTDEEISEANKAKTALFEPLFKIAGESKTLYNLVLISDVIIPHSKSLTKK